MGRSHVSVVSPHLDKVEEINGANRVGNKYSFGEGHPCEFTYSHLDLHFILMGGLVWYIKRFRLTMRKGQSLKDLISKLRKMADDIDATFKEK